MTVNSTRVIPYANNITVATGLSYCDNVTWDFNRTLYDLRDLYQSNGSNRTSNIFLNISIGNLKCNSTMEKYFEQTISFTQAVSIRIQILFVSIYFDYLNTNHFRLNDFIIDRESLIQLSSITVNNKYTSNACSSAEAAEDPLCLTNSTDSICTPLFNPWNFTCSRRYVATRSPFSNSTNQLEIVSIPTSLKSWQLGLIGCFSVLFFLLLLLLSAFFYRRYRHSKQLALSRVNLYDDTKVMQNSGIPQGQAFQRVNTILQPKRRNHTAISWIHDATAINNARHNDNDIDLKSAESLNQVTFVNHERVHDPPLSSNTSPKVKISTTNSSNLAEPTLPSQRVSRTSLKLNTADLAETKFNEYDRSPFHQSTSYSSPRPSTPVSTQCTNLSFVDDNLTDEDAWMSILDVVNAELAILDEEDRIRTSI